MVKTLARNGRLSLRQLLYGTLGLAMLGGAWQWTSHRVTSEGSMPGIPVVAKALADLALQGEFWVEVLTTLGIALLGWAIAALAGVALGVLVGTSEVVRAATQVVLELLRPIPAIVILPLAMLVLGPTLEMGVFLVAFGVMLPITAQVAAGVEAVDPVMRSTARSFGMGPAEILWRVILPGASPYIGTAMRVAAPVTLIMTVVAGMLGGAPGVGSALTIAQTSGRSDLTFAYVVVLGLLGLLMQSAAGRLERRLLHWHSSFRKGD